MVGEGTRQEEGLGAAQGLPKPLLGTLSLLNGLGLFEPSPAWGVLETKPQPFCWLGLHQDFPSHSPWCPAKRWIEEPPWLTRGAAVCPEPRTHPRWLLSAWPQSAAPRSRAIGHSADLVSRRVTPFLAFTLGQSRKKKERVSPGCPPWLPRLGWGWEEQVSKLPGFSTQSLKLIWGLWCHIACNLWPSVEAQSLLLYLYQVLPYFYLHTLVTGGSLLWHTSHCVFRKPLKGGNLFPIIS